MAWRMQERAKVQPAIAVEVERADHGVQAQLCL